MKIEEWSKKLKTASIRMLIIFVVVLLPITGVWSGYALASIEVIHVYNFQDRRYDVGDKLVFL